ncbi:helix-turn-helix domain-containing protein [Alkanindiges sp. WGS2144]|uniref:helix-turn-helix domain-containing protein n=1 Tax=Alkanindiges sp. WGS2144 TaxID=3366808 RepID=UPI003750419F
MNFFSKQLSLLLSRLGISKYKLAKLSGLSPAYITLLTNGERSPSDEAIRKIASIVEVDFHVMQSWVNADKLGISGLENLKQHVLDTPVQSPLLPNSSTLIEQLTRSVELINNNSSSDFIETTLENIQQLLHAGGVALWKQEPKQNIAQIIYYKGLPSEYVVIANLKLAEQGMVDGAAFPVVSVLKNKQPVKINGLLEDSAHPLHFYAKILNMSAVYILPVPVDNTDLDTHLALALYLTPESEALIESAEPWLALYIGLIAMIFRINPTYNTQ